jgi:holliday junction DNA helicase RuvA
MSAEELRLFRLLIAVERIGPKAALGILGRADLATMVRALRSGDAAMVATVPGIGAKTAERVVLELRDKLDGLALPGDTASPVEAGAEHAIRAAVDGLATMGFKEAAARDAVKAALSDGTEPLDVAALVAAALRRLDMVAAG